MEAISLNNIAIKSMVTALPNNTVKIDGVSVPYSVENQTASDLAFEAASKILTQEDINEIGVLLLLTSTPDYRSPASAMVIQTRLGVDVNCIVYDINISMNSFAYGLQVAGSLLQNSSKQKALVLLADTPSKQFDFLQDNTMRLADGATAICLEKINSQKEFNFYNLTRSEYFKTISLKNGGYRDARSQGDHEPYTNLEKLTPLHINVEGYKKNEIEMLAYALNKLEVKSEINLKKIFTNLRTSEKLSKLIKVSDIDKDRFVDTHNEFQLLGSFIPNEMNKETIDLAEMVSFAFGEGLSVSLLSMELDFKKISKTFHTDNYYENGEVAHQI